MSVQLDPTHMHRGRGCTRQSRLSRRRLSPHARFMAVKGRLAPMLTRVVVAGRPARADRPDIDATRRSRLSRSTFPPRAMPSRPYRRTGWRVGGPPRQAIQSGQAGKRARLG